MALDAGTLVRAGGGIALMAAGGVAFVLARGAPPRAGHLPLGFALVAYGAAFVVYNFAAALTSADAAALAEAPFFILAAVGLVVFLVRGPWRVPANDRLLRVLLVTAAVLLFLEVGSRWVGPAPKLVFAGQQVSTSGALLFDTAAGDALRMTIALVAVVAAERALAANEPRRARALGALALGLEAWSAYSVGLNYARPPREFTSSFPLLLIVLARAGIPVLARLSVAFSWVAVARAPGGRVAWIVSWGVLGLVLAGQLDPRGDTGETLLPGIIRTAGALVIIFALTTGALYNGTRPARAARRSTMAAGALATLFIVAQIAQNFLAAQYGLMMGGIVAGAFLFAASPLQRAMESMREGRPQRSSGAVGGEGRGEASYRKAVRWALRDHKLSREEEKHLHELARDLGIDGVRAHEILIEVESEKEVD